MRDIIEELLTKVKDDLTELDTHRMYDDFLDECYSMSGVGGPFTYMLASKILSECDPVAYRCGFNDWLDGESLYEVDGEYYHGPDLERIKDELIDELESDISSLEDDQSDLDEDDEEFEIESQGISNCIAELEELIAKLRKYSF